MLKELKRKKTKWPPSSFPYKSLTLRLTSWLHKGMFCSPWLMETFSQPSRSSMTSSQKLGFTFAQVFLCNDARVHLSSSSNGNRVGSQEISPVKEWWRAVNGDVRGIRVMEEDVVSATSLSMSFVSFSLSFLCFYYFFYTRAVGCLEVTIGNSNRMIRLCVSRRRTL